MIASPDACVAYLVRFHEELAPVRRFAEAYAAHDPGLRHRLLLLRRGFPSEGSWSPFAAAFEACDIQYDTLDVADAGFDLGAYRQAVESTTEHAVCFLNTFSEVLCDGWLEHLHRSAQLPGVGLAGATGSYESVYSAYVAALSVHRANRNRWWLPPVRGYMKAYRLRSEYPASPNPHVRTNGFLVTRSVAQTLRWGPFRSKDDTRRGESGWFSLSRQAEALGLRNVVVGRDGLSYEVADWPSSGTFRSGNQSNLMIADNRTREYDMSAAHERERLSRWAWGSQHE